MDSSPAVFERYGLRVERATSEERLGAWAEAWDRLALRAPHPLPRLSHKWASALLHHASDNAPAVAFDFGEVLAAEPWSCLFAVCEGELLGVLPLVVYRRPLLGIERLVAGPPRGPRETCGDLLLAPGPDGARVLAALVSVAAETVSEPMCLELDKVAEGSPTLDAVRAGVPGTQALVSPAAPVSFLPIRGLYEDYLSQLSASMRKHIRQCGRRHGRLAGSAIEIVEGPDAWRQLDRFVTLEAQGWKGRERSAIGSSASTLDYYRTLTQRLSEDGWLELAFLLAEGRTLAAIMSVKFGRVEFGLRMTYDEGFDGFAPGNALFERKIERAFQSGQVDELNLGSDHAWQRNWRMQRRACWNVRLFPRRPLSLAVSFLPAWLRGVATRVWKPESGGPSVSPPDGHSPGQRDQAPPGSTGPSRQEIPDERD